MAKDWKQLSVLIVGCGSIGRRHAGALLDIGVTDLRACDSIPQARQRMSEKVPSAQLFESFQAGLTTRPDAVFICTPTEMHVPMARKAIRSGSHVLIEKPISDTTENINELSTLAKGENKKVMIGLCFRYHEGVLRVHSALRAGRVGRLVCVRALMGEHLPDVRPDYQNLQCARKGGVFDLMHDLDLAIWLADSPVKQVHAICGNFSNINIKAPDMAEFLLEFEAPCTAMVHLDFFQRPRRRQLELLGTQGVIVLDFAQWDQCTLCLYDPEEEQWRQETIPTERDRMFRAEDQEFLEAIANGWPIRCTIEEGLKSLQVIEQANR